MLRWCEGEDRACATGGGRTLRTDEMRDDCQAEVWQSSLFKKIIILSICGGEVGNGQYQCCHADIQYTCAYS